jgi:hypothetical protein
VFERGGAAEASGFGSRKVVPGNAARSRGAALEQYAFLVVLLLVVVLLLLLLLLLLLCCVCVWLCPCLCRSV